MGVEGEIFGLFFLCAKKEPREVSAEYQCGNKNCLEVLSSGGQEHF